MMMVSTVPVSHPSLSEDTCFVDYGMFCPDQWTFLQSDDTSDDSDHDVRSSDDQWHMWCQWGASAGHISMTEAIKVKD